MPNIHNGIKWVLDLLVTQNADEEFTQSSTRKMTTGYIKYI